MTRSRSIRMAVLAGAMASGNALAQSSSQEAARPEGEPVRAAAVAQVQSSPVAVSPGEVHRPFALSLRPGVSTNGPDGSRVVNNVSLGLLGTHSGRLRGAALALVGNWTDRSVLGLQTSLIHNATGVLEGAQIAVGLNTVGGSMTGLQAAVGLNTVAGNVMGAQIAVGLNVAGADVLGLQAAVGLNVAPKSLTGLQVGAGLNVVSSELRGVQTTAGVGYAGRVRGAQLSIVNVGGDVEGAQIGIINIATRVRGLQLGVVNVAGESDASLGVLSFVPQGLHLQAFASDVALANVALKMGGRSLHSILTVGYQPGPAQDRYYTMGFGAGVHLPLTSKLYADVDLISNRLFREFLAVHHHVHGQLRAVAGLQLASHFSVFAGVTANTLVDWSGTQQFKLSEGWGWKHQSGDVHLRVWPGVVAGLQL